MIDKEYAKLTLEQFRKVVKTLPELRDQMQHLPKLLRSTSPAQLKEIFDEDFHWAEIYELPLIEQLALMAVVLDDAQQIMDFAQSADPQQAALDSMDDESDDEWRGGFGGLFGKKYGRGRISGVQIGIALVLRFCCGRNGKSPGFLLSPS